jgi:hypothetical protein
VRAVSNAKKIHVTVGDLVVAATEAAFEVASSEKKAYRLAGLVVNKMLRPRFRKAGRNYADLHGRRRFN